ncbi:MAG: molybdopterin molybdotransferase MoeA, partial [Planctomycetales bacterium]|nr:molybdopterin molybdotransferase MoeA [Planctomycetales bacterium]
RILAEDITADVDSPPHRKSLVDGYAVQSKDLSSGHATLQVVEEVFAGQVPTRSLASGEATRIMTGAPLPDGADAVAMVEDTVLVDGDTEVVSVRTELAIGQNVQDRGVVMKSGEIVMRCGQRIRPIEIGLLCEVGRTEVVVAERPSVAMLPTGDELVDAAQTPGPGQIRNSNGPMLHALASASGAIPSSLGIGRDEPEVLRQTIESALQTSDILMLSGGVSMGQKDFVPAVLNELNVQTVFHRVQLRPGKPIWFGVWENGENRTLVFGLPGNPVSSFVCYYLFVRPAIDAMQAAAPRLRHNTVHMNDAFTLTGNRPTYFPARFVGNSDSIELLRWKGSADQRTLCEADCLAFLPAAGTYEKAAMISALPLE